MSKLRSLAGFASALLLAVSTLLPACKSTGDDKYDETRNWSAERLYNEAKRRPLYIVQEIAGRAAEPRAGLGVIASGVSPAAVEGEGHQRREDDVGDDRPPRRAV